MKVRIWNDKGTQLIAEFENVDTTPNVGEIIYVEGKRVVTGEEFYHKFVVVNREWSLRKDENELNLFVRG